MPKLTVYELSAVFGKLKGSAKMQRKLPQDGALASRRQRLIKSRACPKGTTKGSAISHSCMNQAWIILDEPFSGLIL